MKISKIITNQNVTETIMVKTDLKEWRTCKTNVKMTAEGPIMNNKRLPHFKNLLTLFQWLSQWRLLYK